MLRVVLISLFLFCPFINAAELTDKEFKSLQKKLTPDITKPWRSIPWKLSVLEAQKAASQSNKPIFIWAMDGHPLACV
jgi:hypothetical protein